MRQVSVLLYFVLSSDLPILVIRLLKLYCIWTFTYFQIPRFIADDYIVIIKCEGAELVAGEIVGLWISTWIEINSSYFEIKTKYLMLYLLQIMD